MYPNNQYLQLFFSFRMGNKQYFAKYYNNMEALIKKFANSSPLPLPL